MLKKEKQNLLDAVRNPPPERLAKIEYQSHTLQAIGIIFVCIMLIMKGFWYIIFAMIFGVGISYSQGIAAYNKYKTIMEYKPKEDPKDFENEISPSRRRSKIIEHSLGSLAKVGSSIFAVAGAVMINDPTWNRWILMFMYPATMFVLYIGFYYYPMYWIASMYYKKEIGK